MLVPSSEGDGAPYESLHVIDRAYPEGIAGVSFCDGNVLVTGSKDHQVGMHKLHAYMSTHTFLCACMCVYICMCVSVFMSVHTWPVCL